MSERRLPGANIAVLPFVAARHAESEPALSRFRDLYGASPAMQDVYRRVAKVAATLATVFITGESGSGKGVVAATVHRLSERASAPFLAVNCGAIPADLIEAELFGCEKGSFTGAARARRRRRTPRGAFPPGAERGENIAQDLFAAGSRRHPLVSLAGKRPRAPERRAARVYPVRRTRRDRFPRDGGRCHARRVPIRAGRDATRRNRAPGGPFDARSVRRRQTACAEMLGVSLKTLYNRLAVYRSAPTAV